MSSRAGKVDDFQRIFPKIPRAFAEAIIDACELHEEKRRDYGSNEAPVALPPGQEWKPDPYSNIRASADCGILPWVYCTSRIAEKERRIQKFARGGELANEPVVDSMLDNIVFSATRLVMFREAPTKTSKYRPAPAPLKEEPAQEDPKT